MLWSLILSLFLLLRFLVISYPYSGQSIQRRKKLYFNGRPTVHTHLSRKQNFSKTFFKRRNLKTPALLLLGVYVQNDLKWNTHVSSIVSKACKRIHYLRVCRTAHLPRDIGLTTYITKIRPVLEYASPVWGGLPIYLEEDLQRVQNRCLNVIGLPRDTVESLVTRRQNLTRKQFKRIQESEAHSCKSFLERPVDHGHNLRSCKSNPARLRIPVSRTVRHKQSFIPRGAKLNLI